MPEAYVQSLKDRFNRSTVYEPVRKEFFCSVVDDTLQSDPIAFLENVASKIAADQATPERMGYVSTGEVRFIRSCVSVYKDHLIRKPNMTGEQKMNLLDQIVKQEITY